ncbi:MAG: hypothetical protein A2046_08680 [Bacteroidetes bacterium GWA2_30_7]|nr:MAG: hypothetical protein A2046_08680 [Bacteroidetes bacterium GWA2_30_7]
MKRTFKKILLFSISLLFISIIISSCGKKREGLLVGNWEYVWVSKNDLNEVILYTFTEGLTVERVSIINGIEKKNTGTYELSKKTGKLFVNIKLDGFTWLNGKYRILHVDKEILIMQQFLDSDDKYAFGRFEFVRKN